MPFRSGQLISKIAVFFIDAHRPSISRETPQVTQRRDKRVTAATECGLRFYSVASTWCLGRMQDNLSEFRGTIKSQR